MKIFWALAMIAALAALQVPASAALNIGEESPPVPVDPVVAAAAPAPAPEAAPAPAPQVDPAWTADVQETAIQEPVQAPVTNTAPISEPVVVEAEVYKVQSSVFVQSEDQMRLLNTSFARPNSLLADPVPEPSSIAGLAAGAGAILFQLRRARKKS